MVLVKRNCQYDTQAIGNLFRQYRAPESFFGKAGASLFFRAGQIVCIQQFGG
jgi:hypothetical protein